MKYLVNFSVEVVINERKIIDEKTSYSILEQDLEDLNLEDLNIDDFEEIHKWFTKYFEKNPLDIFINASDLLQKRYDVNMKITRITNTLSGIYKTY